LTENIRYIVREAKEDKDGAKLAQILSECFFPVTQRQVRQWMQRAKKDPAGSTTLVCEIDGEAISQVSIDFKELHLGEGVYIKTGGIAGVCTGSDQRRKGLMTSLMQQSLDYIKNKGVSTSALYTALSLPAHRIYLRFGFSDVQTWPFHVKILDFPYAFRTWLRILNRYVKMSRIAQKTLQNWNRSVVFELGKVGTHSFRYNGNRFRRLPKPPKFADIILALSPETFYRIMWGALKFGEARQTGKVRVKKGDEADLEMLRKVLIRIWDD